MPAPSASTQTRHGLYGGPRPKYGSFAGKSEAAQDTVLASQVWSVHSPAAQTWEKWAPGAQVWDKRDPAAQTWEDD